MVYKWKTPGIYKVPAEDAANELERIREKHGGILNPSDVVEDSKDTTAVFHNEFEWDDTIAASAYRRSQAQHIILCLVSVNDKQENGKEEPEQVRVYASTARNSYEPTAAVIQIEEKRNKLLNDALRELFWFRAKYRTISELAGVMNAIEEVLENG